MLDLWLGLPCRGKCHSLSQGSQCGHRFGHGDSFGPIKTELPVASLVELVSRQSDD